MSVAAVLALLGFSSACGSGSGACGDGASGEPQFQCLENLDESDCEWRVDGGINGGTWAWFSGKTCAEAGYTYWCGRDGASSSSENGYWTMGSSFCIY